MGPVSASITARFGGEAPAEGVHCSPAKVGQGPVCAPASATADADCGVVGYVQDTRIWAPP